MLINKKAAILLCMAAFCWTCRANVPIKKEIVEDAHNNKILRLEPDEVAIFGYGSLMLPRSVEHTLGHSYEGPTILCEIRGWKRSWSVFFPNENCYYKQSAEQLCPKNVVFLNIEKAEGCRVNGVLMVFKKAELEGFDRRESIYDRVEVNDILDGVVVEGGRAYTYTAKPEFFVSELNDEAGTAICNGYLKVIEEALTLWGEDFSDEYYETTDALPESLVGNAGGCF